MNALDFLPIAFNVGHEKVYTDKFTEEFVNRLVQEASTRAFNRAQRAFERAHARHDAIIRRLNDGIL